MLKNLNGILCLIVLFALALRLYGINFEVPHPDDYITVQGAMHFGLARITPTGYGLYALYTWPAFPMVYIQIVLFTFYFLVGWLVGTFPTIETFRNLYLTDPSSFYLIGRIMCVAFGVGTVWILYYLARRLYNRKVGLLASLFLSVSFIHSFHSQFIRPDIPSLFFIVLTMICSLMILKKGEFKYYVYAGILTGLAIATKFTSVVVIVSIITAHIMAEGKQLLIDNDRLKAKNVLSVVIIIFGLLLLAGSVSTSILRIVDLGAIRYSPHEGFNQEIIEFLSFLMRVVGFMGSFFIIAGILLRYLPAMRNIALNLLTNRKLLSAIGVALISFMVFDPLFFLNFKEQLRIFITDPNFMGKNILFVGVDSLGFWGNLWWYIKGSLNWGAGLHIEIMAALGLFLSLYRKRREDLLILVFPLLYFLVIGFGNFKWERYAIILMPFVALYAASFLHTSFERLFSTRLSPREKSALLSLVAIAIVIHPIYNILRYDYLLTQKDTRVIAKEWVEKNLSHGSKIGQDAYTGDLSDRVFQITKEFSLSKAPLDYYIENGYQYLLVSDTQYKRYLAEPKKYPHNVRFYRRLFSEGELIKEFTPRNNLWPKPDVRFPKYHIHISPTIRLYKIRNDS